MTTTTPTEAQEGRGVIEAARAITEAYGEYGGLGRDVTFVPAAARAALSAVGYAALLDVAEAARAVDTVVGPNPARREGPIGSPMMRLHKALAAYRATTDPAPTQWGEAPGPCTHTSCSGIDQAEGPSDAIPPAVEAFQSGRGYVE